MAAENVWKETGDGDDDAEKRQMLVVASLLQETNCRWCLKRVW